MGMILSFVSDSFFFLPHSLVFFYLWEAVSVFRTEGKRQGYFHTQNFILGFTTIFPRQGVEIYVIFGGSQIRGLVVCLVKCV